MASIRLKSPQEIALMRKSGQIAAQALKEVLGQVKPGITTLSLEKVVTEAIIQAGAKPAFSTVPGYDFSTCININEGVVHGLPSFYVLEEGDLFSIDLGALHKGWYSDMATTVVVGNKVSQAQKDFLRVGKRALTAAIETFRVGKSVGDISVAIEKTITKAGYSPVRTLVGHGIGRSLHEAPPVPCFGVSGTGPLLQVGMVLAIEVIYNRGGHQVKTGDDGWTVVTADGSWGGMFEHTIALTKDGPVILTLL